VEDGEKSKSAIKQELPHSPFFSSVAVMLRFFLAMQGPSHIANVRMEAA
jgi:hypothetical protein